MFSLSTDQTLPLDNGQHFANVSLLFWIYRYSVIIIPRSITNVWSGILIFHLQMITYVVSEGMQSTICWTDALGFHTTDNVAYERAIASPRRRQKTKWKYLNGVNWCIRNDNEGRGQNSRACSLTSSLKPYHYSCETCLPLRNEHGHI